MLGLVLDPGFHGNRKWVFAGTWYLYEAMFHAFDCIIITGQESYNRHKDVLDAIWLGCPGWGSPRIDLDPGARHVSAVVSSDPHHEDRKAWFQKYVEDNRINYVFSYYDAPFFYHYPDFPREKFVHFPWAIPDQFVAEKPVEAQSPEIVLFGAMNHPAYDTRRWVAEQGFVTVHDNSGCENKVMTDEEYYRWLAGFPAVCCAGSIHPQYQLVTPKYFEVLGAGGLLFAQDCRDLNTLGFKDKENCWVWDPGNIRTEVEWYRMCQDTEHWNIIRQAGIELIRDRHMVSHRIELIRNNLNRGQ